MGDAVSSAVGVASAEAVAWGLVPTVPVDVCDAEVERVEDAEPDAEADADVLGVSDREAVAPPLAEAEPDTLGVAVSPPVPVAVRDMRGVPVSEPDDVAHADGLVEADGVRVAKNGLPVAHEEALAEGVSVALLVGETVELMQAEEVRVVE